MFKTNDQELSASLKMLTIEIVGHNDTVLINQLPIELF